MQPRNHALVLVACCWTFAAGALAAQNSARIEFTVVDEAGDPVVGAVISASSDKLNRFSATHKTNQRGKALFSVVDGLATYTFRFQHPDIGEITRAIKLDLGTTKRVNIVLAPERTAAPTEAGAGLFTRAETAFNEGVEAFTAGDDATALAKFLEAQQLDETMVATHAALGRLYLRSENYEEAIASTQRFIELEGADVSSYRVLYDAYTALGRKAEAQEALAAVQISGTPEETAVMLYNEGVRAVRVGDQATAEARFLEALELDPTSMLIVKGLVLIYGNTTSWEKAVHYAESYLASEPGDATVLRVRWNAYRMLGDAEKLEVAQREFAVLDPGAVAEALFAQGLDLFAANDVAAAIAEFEAVLQLQPDHALAHYQLGLCAIGQGENPKAEMHLERFLELAPEHPEAATAREMLSFL